MQTWFRNFERCFVIAQKNEDNVKAQLLMLRLSGQALAAAEQVEQDRNGEQTYAQIRARLDTVFNSVATMELKMVEFENRVQRVYETEDELMLALVKLHRVANPTAADREFQKSVKRKFI